MSLEVLAIPGLKTYDRVVLDFRAKHGFKGDSFDAYVLREHGVIVCRGDHELEAFGNLKDANAWKQHFFGDLASSLQVIPLHSRKPTKGDPVWVDYPLTGNGFQQEFECGWGLIDTIGGETALSFRCGAFRDNGVIDISGGPSIYVSETDFRLVGLRRQRYWTWQDGHVKAHNGGDFYTTMPLWFWRHPTT